MSYRAYCRPCGAHAFDYSGDWRAETRDIKLASHPDGTAVEEGEPLSPCKHVLNISSRYLRVHELNEDGSVGDELKDYCPPPGY